MFSCSSESRPLVIVGLPNEPVATLGVARLSSRFLQFDDQASKQLAIMNIAGPVSAKLVFPGAGTLEASAQLLHGALEGSSWRGEVLDAAVEYRRLAGQHLLTTLVSSPRELARAGLTVVSIQRALVFRWCESAADYAKVLQLRFAAYSAVGKLEPAHLHEAMSDRFDEGASILMAFHGERLVGTARLVLPALHEPTEYDQFVPLLSWVDRASLAVLSRIATADEFRGGNLLYALVLRCLAEASSAGRSLVLGGCARELLPAYQRVGAQATGVTFSRPRARGRAWTSHGTPGDAPEELITFRSASAISGEGVRADLWRELGVSPGDGRPVPGRARR